MRGMLDQVALALLTHNGSAALHDAALAVVHATAEATGVSPAALVGDRWKQPWIDIPSLSLYTQPLVVVRPPSHGIVAISIPCCSMSDSSAVRDYAGANAAPTRNTRSHKVVTSVPHLAGAFLRA